MTSDAGKGDKRRSGDDQDAYADGYDRIWGKKKVTEKVPVEIDEEICDCGLPWLSDHHCYYKTQHYWRNKE